MEEKGLMWINTVSNAEIIKESGIWIWMFLVTQVQKEAKTVKNEKKYEVGRLYFKKLYLDP